VPGNKETVRGFSGVSMVLVDEAARVKDEMFVTLEPMLAVGEGDMWLMSTPKGRIGQVWLEGRRAAMDAAMFRQEFYGGVCG
jgi:hypothetical protein